MTAFLSVSALALLLNSSLFVVVVDVSPQQQQQQQQVEVTEARYVTGEGGALDRPISDEKKKRQ